MFYYYAHKLYARTTQWFMKKTLLNNQLVSQLGFVFNCVGNKDLEVTCLANGLVSLLESFILFGGIISKGLPI